MGFEDISQFELFQGFMGLISISLSIFVGLKIISKYRIHKRIEFLTVGLIMIFITSGWWGSALAFILYVFFNLEISDELYISISYSLLPLCLLLWLYSFGHLVYPKLKWKFVSVWLIISIIYEISFIFFLLKDPNLLAKRISRFDTETQPYVSLYLISSLIVMIITNTIFFWKCVTSDEKKIQWMGRFIFLGVILFNIGAILDSIISLNPTTLLITRTILGISAVITYIGWIMPDRIANWLIKEEK